MKEHISASPDNRASAQNWLELRNCDGLTAEGDTGLLLTPQKFGELAVPGDGEKAPSDEFGVCMDCVSIEFCPGLSDEAREAIEAHQADLADAQERTYQAS